MFKLRMTIWKGHVTRMRHMRTVFWSASQKVRDHMEDLNVD